MLAVHRPRVRCLQVPAKAQTQGFSGVLAIANTLKVHRPFQVWRARKCSSPQVSATEQTTLVFCLSGVPGSADAAGPQIPIAAQTWPGVPGSADAAGFHQVPIAAQTTVGVPDVPGSEPQVLRSSLQHGPPWVYCQASQVCARWPKLGLCVPCACAFAGTCKHAPGGVCAP